MNPVGELVRTEDIYLDFDVPDKERLLERIAEMLAQRRGLPYATILESLTARERLGSTGLGHGVAIPHARMPQCDAAAGVFVRTRLPIAFDAPDRIPVSMFLALIVPQQATERHLQLLATAATMFGDRTFREKVRACPDSAAMRELLAAWPDAPPGATA